MHTFFEEHGADEIDLKEIDIEETSNDNQDHNPDKQDDWMRVQNLERNNVELDFDMEAQENVEVENDFQYTDHKFYTNEEINQMGMQLLDRKREADGRDLNDLPPFHLDMINADELFRYRIVEHYLDRKETTFDAN